MGPTILTEARTESRRAEDSDRPTVRIRVRRRRLPLELDWSHYVILLGLDERAEWRERGLEQAIVDRLEQQHACVASIVFAYGAAAIGRVGHSAHAHLGNLVFDTFPARALVHYEIGMRIGELFLLDGFDGALPWSALYNVPTCVACTAMGCASGGSVAPPTRLERSSVSWPSTRMTTKALGSACSTCATASRGRGRVAATTLP